MSRAGKIGSVALGGPKEASRASEDLDLFDPREFLWSLLLNRYVEALKAWFLCAGYPCSRTEIISPNELADPLDIEILEL